MVLRDAGDLVEEVHELTGGEGVHVVADVIAGDGFSRSSPACKPKDVMSPRALSPAR